MRVTVNVDHEDTYGLLVLRACTEFIKEHPAVGGNAAWSGVDESGCCQILSSTDDMSCCSGASKHLWLHILPCRRMQSLQLAPFTSESASEQGTSMSCHSATGQM